MSSVANFVLHSHRHVAAILKPVAERYAEIDALQAAIKESEVCQNYRSIGSDPEGVYGEECNQPGPLCLNEGCGMCQSCEADGYLCPNAERHDFGGSRDGRQE